MCSVLNFVAKFCLLNKVSLQNLDKISMTRVGDFKSIRLRLASPEEILTWSHGEVTKPETINYRTQRPEKDGLMDERIFGPSKDWECFCGKYRRIRYKGIICDKCGVEVTRAIVRRERMGHIKLAAPVAHVWFLRGVPSKIGLLLDLSVSDLERVIYFAAYLVTHIDEQARKKAAESLEQEFKNKMKKETERAKKEKLKQARSRALDDLNNLKQFKVISELEYHNLSLKYAEVFVAATGAEAVKNAASSLDLKKLEKLLIEKSSIGPLANRRKILKRLKLVQSLLKSGIKPEWMFITILPVIPPELRPMVQLDGGRYASSDLNDLYRRVINRNNRLKKLLELNAPEVIVRNEKRMLQEAVDALIDNSAKGGQAVAASTGQKRLLRSLADMLKGKQGRFRQNLLGKRVDYSGRSVIVIGPELKLDSCGLPKRMALELFKPFVINKLIERGIVFNVRSAGKLIEEGPDEVWAILEEVIQNKYVLLNRAPTLHRLGIQAFRPILIEGSAIQIHPMVTRAFNADFDGDQMAVHLPLTQEAQTEARDIILSTKNLLKPATGQPIVVPTQDIVLGSFYMTRFRPGAKGEGKVFSSRNEAVLAYYASELELDAKIKTYVAPEKRSKSDEKFMELSIGRIFFNSALPNDFPFINQEMTAGNLERLIESLIEKYGISQVSPILDKIKAIGFEYATLSGISWGFDDLRVPLEKKDIIRAAEAEVNQINEHFAGGMLTNKERYDRVIEVWFRTKNEVAKRTRDSLPKDSSVRLIIESKARGSWEQTVQMSGMKGVVSNPLGESIELPVKSSYKEGLSILEYFINTHSARKGTADTALKTATAGYLTRRLVDVSQDVVIREEDCKDKKGITVFRDDIKELVGQSYANKIVGRVALNDIFLNKKSKEPLVKMNQVIDKYQAKQIDESGLDLIQIRSPIICKTLFGLCRKCYGNDLGYNEFVKIGQAVGIVAAQAIGEPGTQLTMRTFHTGGVAGGADITVGLPRVEEIFEVREPKGKALISEVDGKVIDIQDQVTIKIVKIKPEPDQKRLSEGGDYEEDNEEEKETEKKTAKEKKEIIEYIVPGTSAVWVSVGDEVKRGQQLSDGHLDIKELYKIAGAEAVQRYIAIEVQKVYSLQGSAINDKHIEIIIRQMFGRVRIKDAGDSDFTSGEVVEKDTLKFVNKELKKRGKKTAKAAQILLGITKAALTTDSLLSAASFQETTRVLVNAAVFGKEDTLRGLKENVIIGRLIPAGTGYQKLLETKKSRQEKE